MDSVAARGWVAAAVQRLEGQVEYVVSTHLDEVDSDWEAGDWTVDDAVDAIVQAAKAVPAHWAGRLSLAVPLEASASLRFKAPAIEALRPHIMEPPSLYVFAPWYFARFPNDRQEYREAYAANPWGLDADQYAIEFVSSRDDVARRRRWEASNVLWLHRREASRQP